MDKGYVYIARIIDHSGKFVGGYHKIGKSIKPKIRETQLNSTHLPFDVIMIRIFETDNQSALEKLLQICFDDYRVIKEYDDRKNITTEWFDVENIDDLNDKIDNVISCLSAFSINIIETDLDIKIKSDKSIPKEEQNELIKVVKRAKSSKILFKMDGIDYTQTINVNTYILAVEKIVEKFSIDNIPENRFVSKNIKNIKKPYHKDSDFAERNNYFINCCLSNELKVKIINLFIDKLNIDNIEFYIEK